MPDITNSVNACILLISPIDDQSDISYLDDINLKRKGQQMTKIGRKVRNGAQGAYRLSRNGSVCAVTERATGEVKFTGSYAECSEWIGARS